MEKIYYDHTTYIWRTKLNLTKYKKHLIKKARQVAQNAKFAYFDGYGYKNEREDINFVGDLLIENKFDEIIQKGINICKELYTEANSTYNKVNYESWVNVVRSKNPKQEQFIDGKLIDVGRYHSHTDINEKRKLFIPTYTLVYYIQMPNILEGEDGVLYFKGENNEYSILPEEDDLIIMPGHMPHAPNNAPKSKIDRIVLASNVGFENLKNQKSII